MDPAADGQIALLGQSKKAPAGNAIRDQTMVTLELPYGVFG
jgi:hypothetical protein